ncbi:putative DNA repair protein Rad26 [Cladophialophora carrionii]|uniref:Putative DNA repair protein Rad26 n=1 Tax=Cladophialophora carrionii TaxID=86049 RepID=A0A1C1CI53_9EURO|nr:putative DNA repair protein Rad26 [Cladophialophora carrionii]
MDDNEDETDLFDDDGFDSLSETALQELEHNAILSTQAQVQDLRARTPPEQRPLPIPQPRTAAAQALPNSRPLISNPAFHRYLTEEDDSFELIGEEGVPTPVEEYDSFPFRRAQTSEAVRREQFRQQRHGQAYDGSFRRSLLHKDPSRQASSFQPDRGDGSLQNIPPRPDEMMLDAPPQQSGHAAQVDENVQYRLEKLQQERDELAQELRAANDAVSLQKGEIFIVRAKLEEESKGYSRQIGALKKSMEEQLAKHTAQLYALTEKNNNLTTQYNFLQQEHNQEVQESKALRQRLRDKAQPERETSPIATPRRGLANSLRDGFNDSDIMLVSPSKSARRSKPPTPTAANKRKRKAAEPSPIKPLPLRLSHQDQINLPHQPVQTVEPVVPVTRRDKQAERHLKFLQSILKYKLGDTKDPLIEALVKFTLPSSPTKTFSAIVLEGTAQLTGSRLPSDVLQLFVDLWSKCIKEQYYKPISLLLEVVNHIINLEMSVLDADILTALSLVLQSSITINAKNRFEHSPVYHATYGKFRQTPQSILNREINGTHCLDLMLTIAYTVSDDPKLLSLFWRQMNPEFVLMMLNAWQPVSDISLMLRLLSTSIFPATFGSICTDDQQTQVEHWTLSRICYLLWETPRVDEGLPPNTTAQLCHLRLEVMDLLTKLAIASSPHPHDDPSHHGSLLLANDAHAIGRLVRSLYDEVSAMYALHPTTHHLHAELINKGVSLLYHVLQVHGSSINLQEKLSAINGGVHKHRVVLTRLAFSEGFVIDRLVSDETVAMATQMLEESVTPDEADDLVECFPGFKGRGSRAEDD